MTFPEQSVPVASKPEQAAKFWKTGGARTYGLGFAAYRSDDGGANWVNLRNTTAFLSGFRFQRPGDFRLAIRTTFPAGATGVWRSVDGGLSWSGLNQFLPNYQFENCELAARGAKDSA